MVSSITVRGSHVYDEGTLDIVTGVVTANTDSQNSGGKSIVRTFGDDGDETKTMTADEPLRTQVIINPVELPQDAPQGTFDIICRIDGIDYSCSLSGISFLSGYKYDVELTLNPVGITVMDLWYGLKRVTVHDGGNTTDLTCYGPARVMSGQTFSVEPSDGYILSRIMRNGAEVVPVGDNLYPLEFSREGENVTYNIIFVPDRDWYVRSGDMGVHFDGLMNDRYNGLKGNQVTEMPVAQQLVSTWADLSGNGNDAQLNAFSLDGFTANPITDQTRHPDDSGSAWQTPHSFYDSFAYSGWDTRGLKFDGLNDIASFTSSYNGPFTAEFYLCIEHVQKGMCPRFTAEPVNSAHPYPAFFIYGIGTGSNGTLYSSNLQDGIPYRWCGLYGMGVDTRPWKIFPNGTDIVQYDFVFDGEMVYLYIDGERTVNGVTNPGTRPGVTHPELDKYLCSLGSRLQDNSRGLNATFYSYILYDRALTPEEIRLNLAVNRSRFGTRKQVDTD